MVKIDLQAKPVWPQAGKSIIRRRGLTQRVYIQAFSQVLLGS